MAIFTPIENMYSRESSKATAMATLQSTEPTMTSAELLTAELKSLLQQLQAANDGRHSQRTCDLTEDISTAMIRLKLKSAVAEQARLTMTQVAATNPSGFHGNGPTNNLTNEVSIPYGRCAISEQPAHAAPHTSTERQAARAREEDFARGWNAGKSIGRMESFAKGVQYGRAEGLEMGRQLGDVGRVKNGRQGTFDAGKKVEEWLGRRHHEEKGGGNRKVRGSHGSGTIGPDSVIEMPEGGRRGSTLNPESAPFKFGVK
ncbi:hypothetical protein BCR34DRAFT_610264 [Clohesyomyces aquaticus]|uniref:Uncharacterized protein n=1 Tax=Clohesyomyces aquaticus TaxID=1231657 RepID=A0A1Y2A7V7_9PLEO|nr:hypothetical protein BCR34DRAFT_610264 [Clohesyomyces aquaticus]